MYAVIETGGKQYRVEVGTVLEIERLEAEAGASITLDRVLLVADGDEAAIGRPIVADATVSAEVVRQDRGDKVISFKYRPKARRRVKKGHRQELTVLRISDITYNGRSAAEAARASAEASKTERERLEEAAARQAAADAALAAKLAARQPAKEQAEAPERPARGRRAKATAAEPTTTEPEAAAETGPTPEATGVEAQAVDAEPESEPLGEATVAPDGEDAAGDDAPEDPTRTTKKDG